MRLSATRLTSICGIGRKAWTPRLLFAPGDLGAWYDPSDLLTLFQDSVGTTPVTTAGQPIGLMLDKRYGLALGSELVSNPGGPFVTTSGWGALSGAVALTVSGGNLVATPGTTALTRIDTPISVTAGRTYKLIVNVVQFSGAGPTLAVLTSHNGPVVPGTSVYTSTGVTSIVFTPTATGTIYLTFGSNVPTVGVPDVISSASIKELPGSHARQATTTARPAYRTAPSFVDCDGIDDALVTTFASSLGANCTIVRAVPNVGAVILTGQTIGTTYSDNQDHCGLLIINRALTAIETARITNYFNAKSF